LIVLFYRPRGETTAARLSKAHGSGIGDDALKDAVNLAAGLNSGFVITAAVKGSKLK